MGRRRRRQRNRLSTCNYANESTFLDGVLNFPKILKSALKILKVFEFGKHDVSSDNMLVRSFVRSFFYILIFFLNLVKLLAATACAVLLLHGVAYVPLLSSHVWAIIFEIGLCKPNHSLIDSQCKHHMCVCLYFRIHIPFRK